MSSDSIANTGAYSEYDINYIPPIFIESEGFDPYIIFETRNKRTNSIINNQKYHFSKFERSIRGLDIIEEIFGRQELDNILGRGRTMRKEAEQDAVRRYQQQQQQQQQQREQQQQQQQQQRRQQEQQRAEQREAHRHTNGAHGNVRRTDAYRSREAQMERPHLLVQQQSTDRNAYRTVRRQNRHCKRDSCVLN